MTAVTFGAWFCRYYGAGGVLAQSGAVVQSRPLAPHVAGRCVVGGVFMRSLVPGFRRFRLLPAFAAACLPLLVLAGCDNNPDETAAQCPKFSLLPHDDGATVLRYTSRGTDLTDLVLNGRITDVKGECIGVLGAKDVKAKAHLIMVFTRGPAAPGPETDVRYGMGIVKKGQVLDAPQIFTQHVVFPPNVNTIQVEGQEVDFDFPTPHGLSGPDYQVYVYFQLTPQELALAQAHRS
jgi:hypothetical protein